MEINFKKLFIILVFISIFDTPARCQLIKTKVIDQIVQKDEVKQLAILLSIDVVKASKVVAIMTESRNKIDQVNNDSTLATSLKIVKLKQILIKKQIALKALLTDPEIDLLRNSQLKNMSEHVKTKDYFDQKRQSILRRPLEKGKILLQSDSLRN